MCQMGPLAGWWARLGSAALRTRTVARARGFLLTRTNNPAPDQGGAIERRRLIQEPVRTRWCVKGGASSGVTGCGVGPADVRQPFNTDGPIGVYRAPRVWELQIEMVGRVGVGKREKGIIPR